MDIFSAKTLKFLGFNINITINRLKFCLFVLIVLIIHSVEFGLVCVLLQSLVQAFSDQIKLVDHQFLSHFSHIDIC